MAEVEQYMETIGRTRSAMYNVTAAMLRRARKHVGNTQRLRAVLRRAVVDKQCLRVLVLGGIYFEHIGLSCPWHYRTRPICAVCIVYTAILETSP
jgi:hypothetical protein